MFIGREEELNRLSKLVEKEGLSLSLLYGRRRIGKSELIKQLIKKHDFCSIYYECKEVSEASNVLSISEIVSDKFNLPKLGYNDLESILKFIFELSKKQKILLVIDEYPYLHKTIKGVDSILQSTIDNSRDWANVSVVLLGSYIDIMKSLLEKSNPLYGRVDLSIDLKQMNYYDSSKFYPNYTDEEKVKIYSVFGGIPYYNNLIDDSLSVKENIINLISSPYARLKEEVPIYLGSEIAKIANANEVFDVISRDFSKFSDILDQSHVTSAPTLVDVLDKLIQMDVVEKIAPINDKNNKRKTGYFICDNLTSFYYRYIFRYSSQLNIMNENVFYAKYIEKDFEEQYVPKKFENICKQYLIRKNKQGKTNPPFEEIGKYYYDNPKEKTNGEFDLVTKDENGYIFYEVKFRNHPLTNKIIEEEIKQVDKTKLNCYKYCFISKSGFEDIKSDNIELIKLDEIYQ